MDLSKFEGFLEFMEEIDTQDNRATQKPILIELQAPYRVYTKVEECGGDSGKALDVFGEEECEEYGIDPEEDLSWKTIWEGKQWFFTYSGLKKHLELNGHNYRNGNRDGGPRDYVQCLAYRNPEMIKLFEWLHALKDELVAEKIKLKNNS